MFLLRFSLLPILLWLAVATPLQAETAEQFYARFSEQPGAGSGRCIELEVDLAASPGFSVETGAEGVELRYRMAFNNITEGWSWQPGVDPQAEDYYRYKFLPLQTISSERGDYSGEDKIGVVQTMKISWRYDYFLAFENLYDFYPRGGDDDAGFVVRLATPPVGPLGLRARACLQAPLVSESTTFWKATYGKPVDFTLKKRYLVARLQALHFFERESGRELAVLVR